MTRKSILSALWTRRAALLLAIATLAASVLPLYVISLYNHPYYDDFGFSAKVHHVWQATGSLPEVLAAAWESAGEVRATWQGTYTGTLFSNLQPGVFSEGLYFIGAFFILTAFLLCFWFFFATIFGREGLGLDRLETSVLACLTMALMVQFMPDAGEAFFWFNGGIGNVFIYSLLALAAGLLLKLYKARSRGRAVGLTAALALVMALLGGGSYPGGLFGLCCMALVIAWQFVKRRPRKWHFLGLWLLFAACFLYSMAAPGNSVRAGVIGHEGDAVKSVLQAVYYGVALMGSYLRLPLIGLTAVLLPFLCRAAKASPWRFNHPWLLAILLTFLFCTQLVPTLYSGVGLGGDRTVDTYWLSFVTLWLMYAYYLAGYVIRRASNATPPPQNLRRGMAVAGVTLTLLGCLGFKQPGDTLYGMQNMAGFSAAISVLNGEAAQYHREMTAREVLLNDPTLPTVTLAPLTAVPKVFMEDAIAPDALYDVRPALCEYYGKTAIVIAGEEAVE